MLVSLPSSLPSCQITLEIGLICVNRVQLCLALQSLFSNRSWEKSQSVWWKNSVCALLKSATSTLKLSSGISYSNNSLYAFNVLTGNYFSLIDIDPFHSILTLQQIHHTLQLFRITWTFNNEWKVHIQTSVPKESMTDYSAHLLPVSKSKQTHHTQWSPWRLAWPEVPEAYLPPQVTWGSNWWRSAVFFPDWRP